MAYLFAILVSLALFAGFLVLTAYERRRGFRVAGALRARLDTEAARVEFVLAHVDFASFFRAGAIAFAERVAHDIAHGVLRAVRLAEKLLSRAVRALRARRAQKYGAAPAPQPAAESSIARTVSDIKTHLRRHTRPDSPEE